ncbi:MAG: tetratricopeptide repeat protein [Bacteroidia bacterium]|nr:tetratricopeptide repeat protein [Bacteroidia bacterium]
MSFQIVRPVLPYSLQICSLQVFSIISILIILNLNPATGQNSDRFGADSAKCVENLSFYREFIKQKNYVEAVKGWRIVFNICPQATKSIYSEGVKIYEYLIENEKNSEIRNKLIDTLLMIYDQRIKYYGNDPKYPEGWILGRKGNALFTYRKESTQAAYDCFSKSLRLMGNNTEEGILTPFIYYSIELFNAQKHNAGQVVNDYVMASEIIEFNIGKVSKSDMSDDKKKEKINKLTKAKENIDNYFVLSAAATCDLLIPVFMPKIQATPDDVVLMKKIFYMLNKKNCTEDTLFFNMLLKLNQIEPSAIVSSSIAKILYKQGKYTQAIEYFNKAVALEPVDTLKAQYYFEMAAIVGTKLEKYAQSRQYAQKALEIKPYWGKPYILIAWLYASSSNECGTDEFEKKTVYWAAVDKLNYAKALDKSVTTEADKLITSYTALFPNIEDAHFHSISAGQTYTIGCWINETTKARF